MIKRICKWMVFKCLYPIYYRMASCKRVDKRKVIFVENHQEKLTDNFELLYQQLQQKNYQIHVHYLKVSASGWKDIITRSLTLLNDMADAGCVFLNESNSLFGVIKLRKETKLIQVWHACGAFKKWGYSVADKSFGEDRENLKRYSGHRNYTLVPVSGNEVCWAYEEAFGLEKNSNIVKPLGVSRTDVFFDERKKEQAVERLQCLGIPLKGRKVLVYLPTFRGEIRYAKAPAGLDMINLCELQGNYVILIKNHPFVKKRMEIPEPCREFCREVTDEMTVEELMLAADICVTDYSSVIFEFSLLQKPILFFAYDLEQYYDERGFYYSYEDFVPGPVLRTTKELADCVKEIDVFDYRRLRKFREKFMDGCDGHSTGRILEEIFGDGI